MSEIAPLSPERILVTLDKHRVRFVLIGALAASVDDIIRSKEAAGRPKDREDVAILRAMHRKR